MALPSRYCGLAHVSNFPYLSTQLQDADSPSPEHFRADKDLCLVSSVQCIVLARYSVGQQTAADPSNKSDILPSLTLGTMLCAIIQKIRDVSMDVSGVSRISRSQQPAACNLTINQGTKPPSCGTMSAETQLYTRPGSAARR